MNFLNLLKKKIFDYEVKKGYRNIYICDSDKRFENRREEYSIPEYKPQCPVYKDNRCCGGCFLANTCGYAVNCNCFGYCFGTLGCKDENYYMNNKSCAKYGAIINEKFDFGTYNYNKNKTQYPNHYFSISKGSMLNVFYLESKLEWYKVSDKETAKIKKELEALKRNFSDFDFKLLMKDGAEIGGEHIHEKALYVDYCDVLAYDANTQLVEIDTTKTGGTFKGFIPCGWVDYNTNIYKTKYKENLYNIYDVFDYLESYNTENIKFSHIDYENLDKTIVSYYFNSNSKTGQSLFVDVPKLINKEVFSDTLGIDAEFDELVKNIKKIYEKYC